MEDTPGVSRREISWRDDGPRLLPRIPPLPVWLDAVVLAVLAVVLLAGLGMPGLTRGEAAQVSLTSDAGTLITRPGSLFSASSATPAQDAVRLAYGSFTRYLAAPGWYVSAGRRAARPIDLALADPAGSGPVPVTPIHRRDLIAARIGPAIAGALAVLMLFLLARRLLGRPAATVAVVVFAVQPLVLSAGRQVSDAGIQMLFGLAAVFVAAGIGARLAAGSEPTLTGWTALGLWSGLCLAAGMSAAPFLAGAVAFCVAGLIAGQIRRQRALMAGQPVGENGPGSVLAWMLLTALGAVAVWVAASPALWGWLPGRLGARHDDRAWLIARGLVDDPGEQGLGGVLQALPRLLHAPAPAVVLYLVALAGAGTLIWASRSRRVANLSRRGAVALLVWAAATLAWFVAWPSVQPDHELPLLAVAALMAASLVAWLQNAPIGVGSWMARDLPPSRRTPRSTSPGPAAPRPASRGPAAPGSAAPGSGWADEFGDDRRG